MTDVTPMLWFDHEAEQAADFYVSLFPDSRILDKARRPSNAPGVPGEVMVVAFELAGRRFSALNAGPMFKFTEAISLVIECKDQAEIDHYWDGLTADGGAPGRCGWLKDRWGLSWQVVPALIPAAMRDPAKAGRVMAEVMKMGKLELAILEAAAAEV